MSSRNGDCAQVDPDLAGADVALVHDWLNQVGGAESVLEELVGLFPQAPVYTSMYAPQRMPDAYRSWAIRTSFMQHLPGVTDHHQRYLPIYPLAFERTDLTGYDLVISNKSGFCHGVKTHRNRNQSGQDQKQTLHICYCLTPTRYLWLYEQYRERERIGALSSALLQPILAGLRRWDRAAAQRVDFFVAISREVQQRIRTIYGRESVVIHPPVDTDYFTPQADLAIDDYYLIVSRLIPYKRIDLAVQAFNRLPQEKLLIVGDGRDAASLRGQAGPNITFLGWQSRDNVLELLRGCKAFIFPGLEDFGIAPVEAMSAGRPVIAFGGGGALDTVVAGVSGELFAEQSVASLQQTVQRFQPQRYTQAACRRQAERFSRQTFRTKMRDLVAELLTANRPVAHARMASSPPANSETIYPVPHGTA